MDPIEAFHGHHAELIDDFKQHRDRVLNDPYDQETLEDLVEYFDIELLPHARAEEAVLYGEIDEISGTELATATMRADHEALDGLVERFREQTFNSDRTTLLQQFSVMLLHHFEKEEEVLIPFLQESLPEGAIIELLEEVHQEEGVH